MIDPIPVLKEIVKEGKTKIVLLVIDGVGGLPVNGKTELEAASIPELDKLARESSCGLIEPVFPGLTPGSGPGHLALFGYHPIKYNIGRGILEALGVDLEVKGGDVTARGNFCTVEGDVVVDRRAGRISTEKNRELIELLRSKIERIEDVEVILKSGREHRFVLLLRGPGLSDRVTDTDPHKEGERVLSCRATAPEGEKTARVVNEFLSRVREILKNEKPANFVLLRGFSGMPDIPLFPDTYKIKACGIATYPMYRGLARLVGMEVYPAGETPQDLVHTLRELWQRYDYFYLHVKKTDSYGEDGNFDGKVHMLEEVDRIIPEILSLSPDVFAVTGDHSTPVLMRSHSWHPVPFILHSRFALPDDAKAFTERECAKGILGRFPALYVTSLLLAHAGRLDKFGA